MEIKGKVHCFFEQSGTFKRQFMQMGIPAECYDIQDNFNETDHLIDLFNEIETGYTGGASIFDSISTDDLIIAFFPCIFFCENNQLYFRGRHYAINKQSNEMKIKHIIQRADLRNDFYKLILKFCGICENKKIRLIIENPYSTEHYLHNNFPYEPAIIDKDRTQRGDFFKKPTQFFFINCEPTHGATRQPTDKKDIKKVGDSENSKIAGVCSEERSMISSDYARNFICDFILGKEQPDIQKQLTLF